MRFCFCKPLQCQVHQADGGHGFHDDRSAEGKTDVVTPAHSGFCYAGGGFEGNAEHNGITVCDAAVHATGVVCNGRLGPVMTAAAVVLAAFFPVMTVTALVIRVVMMAMVTFFVLSVAAFMIRVVVMAMVTFLMLSVAAFMLREEVYVL